MMRVNLRRTLIAALVAEIWLPSVAIAQSTPEAKKIKEETETTSVTVTGIRASLASSLSTKRMQEGVVDVVSAEDVGKFPDTNIAESLQRVTGVQIQRENGEGRFISVRGLGPEFNNVLFNGRTLSSDNLGRQFSFDLLSSDLIAKTLVYKSSLPGLPEGGIGSTVDIQTARPLSIKENRGSINASGAYDTISKKVTSNVGGMYSWSNAERNFGLLGTFAWTDRSSKQNTFINDNWSYKDVLVINGTDNSKGLTAADTTKQKLYVPQSLGFQQEDERRRRLVGNVTMQYNPTNDWKLTFDALYSRLNQTNNIVAVSDWITHLLNPTINNQGQVLSFTRPGLDFWSNNPALFGPTNKPIKDLNSNDMIAKRDNRRSVTNAYGMNSIWQVNPDIKVVTDLSTSRTSSEVPGMWIVNGFKPAASDYLTFGNIPNLKFGNSVIDPNQVWAHVISWGIGRGKDEVREARTTLSWVKEIGAFKGVETGLGLQTRHLHSFTYGNDAWDAYSGYSVKLPSNLFSVNSFGDFLDGQAPSGYLSYDPFTYMNYLSQPALVAQSNNPAKYGDITRYPNGFTAIDYNNPRFWSVDERVKNLFLDTKWEGRGWSANAGFRYVAVDTLAASRAQKLMEVTKNPAGTRYVYTWGPNVNQYAENSYSSFLPSANLKYDINSDMLLRIGISKTETRPTLNELSVTNSYGSRVGNVTAGGGNPYLKPMKATNFDVSYEWYLSKTDYISLAAYHKKLSSFLERFTLDTTAPEFPGEVIHDTRTRNTQTGKISGAEIAGQFMLDKVHPWLKNVGASANFTYVKASAERAPGTVDCGYPGLSPKSFNASIFYEDSKFSARLSYNKRDAYVIGCGSGVVLPTTRAAFGQADASLRYNITDAIQLYADIINLNNARSQEYSLNETMFLNLKDQGRRLHAGARLKF